MPRTAVLFNPQVHVKPGDYHDLYESVPLVRARLAEASQAVGLDLAARFLGPDPDEINHGPVVRPASLALSAAIFELVWGDRPPPFLMAGLSLGQITAAHCSGSVSFRDAARMVHTMATVEEEVYGGGEYGVAFYYNVDVSGLRGSMRALADEGMLIGPCAYTADDQMIATGAVTALQELNRRALSHGGLGVLIPYGPPAHHPMMAEVQERFAAEFHYLDAPRDPRAPLICNMDAAELRTQEDVHRALVEQYTHTVNWDRGLHRMAELGVERVTVIGPGHFVRKSLDFTSATFEIDAYLTAADLPAARSAVRAS
ncbi:ACP S-malonyltransferase [Actinomadura sp. WMMA1423]|uniref:ACP S-malonyltransferase n=1 Tax=Actinomadura sp. WMMA1423 TaxID=2591108 RepID=UPI00114742FB|nr:ACP S-malonyltransferase [Actinomadura sp. WMMA1423]